MLTERQMLILQAVIDAHASLAEPVGSKALAGDPHINASSATIRNEMSYLEKLGLLTKMHSSSGRVPTESGYRYYINYILPRYGGLIDRGLSRDQAERVEEIFASPYTQLADIIARSTEAMAELTSYVAIALGPQVTHHRLAAFRIVGMTPHKAMAILITDQEAVENQVFTIPEGLDEGALDQLVHLVNEELVGLPLYEVVMRLRQDYIHYLDRSVQHLLEKELLIQSLLMKLNEERLNIQGTDKFYQTLSKKDEIDQILNLNALLSDQDVVTQLIEEPQTGIQIRIGKELEDKRLKHMSLMTSTIGEEDPANQITFAILGPETMSYLQVAQLFNGMRSAIRRYLDESNELRQN